MHAPSLLQELDEQYLLQRFEILIQQAYEKGIEDGEKRFTYPPVLKREHLKEILSIEYPTVDKLTRDPSFPRLTAVTARYPRDAVFKWIEDNTVIIEKYS
ncbi:hypothetical protein ACIQ4I_12170 [Rummeliibacillus sp. NPDC094406]|uniref:hypothetical protein n=1 Tax=Rummeliibacillus sp. NPDC094406 TaxID=3364511 RepID=UPI003802A078